jgi:hypothetical protein
MRVSTVQAPRGRAFFDRMVDDPEDLVTMGHVEYVREAGSEGVELVMWLAARGAPPEKIRRHDDVLASNTAAGQLILTNQAGWLRRTDAQQSGRLEIRRNASASG